MFKAIKFYVLLVTKINFELIMYQNFYQFKIYKNVFFLYHHKNSTRILSFKLRLNL